MSIYQRLFRRRAPGSGSSSKRSKSPAPQAASNNTPSTANQSSDPAPTSSSTNASQPQTPVGGRASLTGHMMLLALKGSTRLLQKGCHAFSPLESAVEDLLKVFEASMENANQSEELRETVSDLAQWATVLSDYLASDSRSGKMPGFVKKLTEDLAEELKYIKAQQQSGKLRRLLESGQEMEGLERCYRRLETSFHQVQTDATVRTWKIVDDQLKESRLNALNPSHNAPYNSSFSDKIERRGCLENTREAVLGGIRGWIYSPGGAKIYWTNGMAGTGKTTIAYSVCTELERDGRLGASFFCSRASSECSDVSRILPTIAFQLAQQFSPFRSSLCRILGEKPSIGRGNISEQFEHLIKTPLIEVEDTLPNGHVIVIDALDECSDPPRTIEKILHALFNGAAKLPIRFFLTSRPEPAIANTFLSRDDDSRSILHLHNVEEQLVKADIETYLRVTLAKLSLKEDQIQQLVEQAGVLFIYAATLARYILAPTGGADASKRLITALTGEKNPKSKKDREIDRLYKAILDGVLGDEELEEGEVELIKRVIWTVVCVGEPVTKGTLATFLDAGGEQISSALEPLRSILQVLEGSDVVSTLHASFPEFMLSSERSGTSLYCNEMMHSEYLARKCFRLMEEQLRFNICGLQTSYQFDADVPDLNNRIEASISLELFYACRYWAKHLRQSPAHDELMTCLDVFLHKRLLFWMEVLNLKGWITNGAGVLAETRDFLTKVDGRSNTHDFVRDARNFVDTFAKNSVRNSTPHIYVSALPLVPRQSEVWKCYWGRTRGLLWVDNWLNGGQEAQLSQDGAVIIWGAYRGTSLASQLRGPAGEVSSFAFSPDGTRLVSGSRDYTIRVWDLQSGTQLGKPLKGHTGVVSCVAFLPDGSSIVSGSGDCDIRVWGEDSSKLLRGHDYRVACIDIAPDGTRIVSGSWDHTVRVWDTLNGTQIGSTFIGHTDWVSSVASSPDGTRVVSGSYDCTTRVWDVCSGATVGSPYIGHADWVSCVTFSPDGTQIVSGSSRGTIRMWDVHSGAALGSPFMGHTGVIQSLAFTPDGTCIISGSHDCTIRVWGIHSSIPIDSPFEGHTIKIDFVTFSQIGTHLDFDSRDFTIQVPESTHIPRPQAVLFESLDLDVTGWLVDSTSQAPVLWLPETLCHIFPRPPSTLVISPVGPVNKPKWGRLLLGPSWTQCYDSSAL